MNTVPVWIVLVVLGVIGTLAMLLWKNHERRLNGHDDVIEKHSDEIATIKVKTDKSEKEIELIRSRYHDLKDEVSSTLAGWYTDLVRRFGGGK